MRTIQSVVLYLPKLCIQRFARLTGSLLGSGSWWRCLSLWLFFLLHRFEITLIGFAILFTLVWGLAPSSVVLLVPPGGGGGGWRSFLVSSCFLLFISAQTIFSEGLVLAGGLNFLWVFPMALVAVSIYLSRFISWFLVLFCGVFCVSVSSCSVSHLRPSQASLALLFPQNLIMCLQFL